MWVFVDDSGDCGFKFDNNSSTHLVLAACVFRSRRAIADAIQRVEAARIVKAPDGRIHRRNREFKYSSSKDSHKDAFFEHVRGADYMVRAIVLDKRRVYSSHLLDHPNDMKSYLIRQLLTHTLGTVQGAKLIIDGKDTNAFGMADREYFMRVVNREAPHTIEEVEYAQSERNNLIQLADMTAGSIRRTETGDQRALAHRTTYIRRFAYPSGSLWRFQ